MITPLRRALGPFKEFGVGAGALYIVDRLLRMLSPRVGLYVYEMMVQPITAKPLLPPNLAKNLSFAEIGRDHPDIALMPARPDIKQSRFDQGAVCLGAYRKGKLIAYMWFCSGRYAEDEVRCTYELVDRERSVFDFDLYVMPENRMGLGFMGIWHGANAYLHERGVRYTFSRMTRFNLASRRAHTNLGSKAVARAMLLQMWNVELLLASCAPHVALTWKPVQRTTLRLGPDVLGPLDPESVAAADAQRTA